MSVIPFGEWMPDRADYRNPGITKATNVLPTASGYEPMPKLTITTDALDARPRGAIAVKDKSGDSFEYAGDSAKLYEKVDNSWTDRSKSGGYSTASEERWEFVQWENKILATNFSDDPQQITMGGSNFSDLTTDFKSRHIAIVGNFVVHANTSDATDGLKPNRVRWSAIGDETDYTVSASTLSDFQDLKGGGAIQAVVGGEFGVIVAERAIWRMQFVGAPTVFQIDEVLPEIGAIAPGAVIRESDRVYFLSERGFFEIVSGTQARPIGAEKVDDFVLGELDQSNKHRIYSAADVVNKRIFFAYPGPNNQGGRPNRIVVYDQTLDRWSIINTDVELIYQGLGTGVTLDGLDSFSTSIDDLNASLDSRQWQGGVRDLYAFNKDFKAGAFNGSNMDATIDTQEFEINTGFRTRLNAFWPVVDGGSVTAKVGTRDRQQDVPQFGPELTQRPSGRFTTRSNARYHRFRLNITGDWSDAIGVQFDRSEARRAEKRG